jgi:ATF/CREB family transcription factor
MKKRKKQKRRMCLKETGKQRLSADSAKNSGLPIFTDNDQLQHQAEHLREEIINLKTLLLAHKHCKVAQMNQQMSFQQVNYFNPATNTSGLPSPPPGYSQHPAL